MSGTKLVSNPLQEIGKEFAPHGDWGLLSIASDDSFRDKGVSSYDTAASPRSSDVVPPTHNDSLSSASGVPRSSHCSDPRAFVHSLLAQDGPDYKTAEEKKEKKRKPIKKKAPPNPDEVPFFLRMFAWCSPRGGSPRRGSSHKDMGESSTSSSQGPASPAFPQSDPAAPLRPPRRANSADRGRRRSRSAHGSWTEPVLHPVLPEARSQKRSSGERSSRCSSRTARSVRGGGRTRSSSPMSVQSERLPRTRLSIQLPTKAQRHPIDPDIELTPGPRSSLQLPAKCSLGGGPAPKAWPARPSTAPVGRDRRDDLLGAVELQEVTGMPLQLQLMALVDERKRRGRPNRRQAAHVGRAASMSLGKGQGVSRLNTLTSPKYDPKLNLSRGNVLAC